jgi:hypothetical protein
MRSLLTCLALVVASPALGSTITINAFNDSTTATVAFNDGAGHSGSIATLLTQFNVTVSGSGNPAIFDTFPVDLFHTVSVSQTYAVTPRNDWPAAFVNAARMGFIYPQFGLQNLASNPIRLARSARAVGWTRLQRAAIRTAVRA